MKQVGVMYKGVFGCLGDEMKLSFPKVFVASFLRAKLTREHLAGVSFLRELHVEGLQICRKRDSSTDFSLWFLVNF